jgi:6-pyruvoyltetrahydropterin/6-carboxytetrahydropterin synthase
MNKSTIYLTRRERFSSAHKLENKNISNKKNEKIFGKCLNLHGHNYELFVTVKGNIKEENGFVCDLKELSSLLKRYIINKLDHKFLNEESFMKGKIASTENLCISIWEELEKKIHSELNCQLHCVKIYETENNIVEYFG